ncbi:MAG TPA: phosphoribosylamine--glycine ligase [Candidatus Oscillibacter excrementigallinarum]|uniref:Phosphoribosylamine--glycine ligase n=1 Tax=Candidatus Oscillibacter excrementigallinarum TaxID=2838716 RepID=A0A9D2LGZ8_9FIRM|nr:phosphoribosylamine--glycine ligase [Candidatus Oscillibacter excrementigallinarum]
MTLLIVGGGGREHAIIKKLKENPNVETIYALPGNGGIAADAVCVPEIGATDIDAIVAFARSHAVDFAVVAPDDPLALGCVDALHAAGIPCFGPDAKAARIESSKVFAKDLMQKYHIPTAQYQVFDAPVEALAFLKTASFPIVIKADGLALGKGVLIPRSYAEAEAAVRTIMEDRAFGDSGSRVVIEEFLTGPEVSVLAFTDGTAIAPMVSSMDHKRAGDGDTGPNTGGMGTVAPNPCYTEEVAQVCMDTIFLPTLAAMRAEGCPFKGCLYFGLMLTPDGPKVIEYNCRFGDPETQVVLPLLRTDLLTVMQAVENETLGELTVEWRHASAACVILASGGYPGHYEKGKAISLPKSLPGNVTIYHAGDKLADGQLVTSGGRVLGVTATGPTLRQALQDAYAAAETVDFDGKYLRHDIGRRALAALAD